MYDYVFGTLFTVIYAAYMYFVGGAFTKKQKSYPYQFVIGYLIFSFCVAVGGIIIQILNLPWMLFVLYLIMVFIGLALASVILYIHNDVPMISFSRIPEFFKNQWFLIFAALALILVYCTNLVWIWQNNSLDDGYYLSWVAALPYNTNGFFTQPSTGFIQDLKGMGSYIFNTTYTEYSVYVYFFHFTTSVFCRFFMGIFNYFLYGCCAASFCEFVVKQTHLEVKDNFYQYACGMLFLFGFAPSFLSNNNIINLPDLWQFNTAMFYGSSIVRTMGIFMLLLPFLEKTKISVKEILLVGGIGVALISKSSIALPIIVIVSISYLFAHWICSKDKLNFVFVGVGLILMFAVSLVLGNNQEMEEAVMTNFANNMKSIIFWPCVLFFATSFFYGSRNIIRYNLTLLFFLGFMVISPINNIFETASIYNFVANRAMITFIYTFVVSSYSYMILDILMFIRFQGIRKVLFIGMDTVLCVSMFLVSYSVHDGLISSYKVIYENPNIMPESTIKLGQALEQRYEETQIENVVICNESLKVNSLDHSLSVILRTVTPHSISLSATFRYGEDQKGAYQGFTEKQQQAFHDFMRLPNLDTYVVFSNIMNTYGVNCVVLTSDETGELPIYYYDSYLASDGFTMYAQINDANTNVIHYVYCR